MTKEELIEKIKADDRFGDELAIELLKDIEELVLEVVESEFEEKYNTLLADYRSRFGEKTEKPEDKNDIEEIKEEIEEIDIKEI